MTNAQPTIERNLDGYDNPPIPWQRVQEVLASDITQVPGSGGPDRYTPWLATVDPDGKPHVMPVGMLFLGGNMYFSASRASRKARNIERDPRCTVTVATQPFDLVLEGTAALVTDADELAGAAGAFAAGGWEPVVEDGALTAPYSAPSAGPPPWHVYRITPRTVFALATAEPYGAMRFDL